MVGKITFTLIKPGAVNHEHIGPILTMINDAGFKIVSMKFLRLTREEASLFYKEHRNKDFFDELIDFICSGPVVAMILMKDNAVRDYRELMGDTDPQKAEEGTIRRIYAEDLGRNAVHGSDSDENAQREANFFFSQLERYPDYHNDID